MCSCPSPARVDTPGLYLVKRRHFTELHDSSFCPGSLRAAFQEFLAFFARATGVFDPVAPVLSSALRRTGERTIVDLCSGAGGPWPALAGKLAGKEPVRVLLTDMHPPRPGCARDARTGSNAAAENAVPDCAYRREPVDARALPEDIHGICTLFSSFHHFKPDDAGRILSDAARNGMGICVFEATSRNLGAALPLFFLAPFFVLAMTPWIRPFRWSRLFWTYLVPAIPFMMGFDGLVSCLRTYTPEEMLEIASGLGIETYTWESGSIPARGLPARITYLVGLPAAQAPARTAPV